MSKCVAGVGGVAVQMSRCCVLTSTQYTITLVLVYGLLNYWLLVITLFTIYELVIC